MTIIKKKDMMTIYASKKGSQANSISVGIIDPLFKATIQKGLEDI